MIDWQLAVAIVNSIFLAASYISAYLKPKENLIWLAKRIHAQYLIYFTSFVFLFLIAQIVNWVVWLLFPIIIIILIAFLYIMKEQFEILSSNGMASFVLYIFTIIQQIYWLVTIKQIVKIEFAFVILGLLCFFGYLFMEIGGSLLGGIIGRVVRMLWPGQMSKYSEIIESSNDTKMSKKDKDKYAGNPAIIIGRALAYCIWIVIAYILIQRI